MKTTPTRMLHLDILRILSTFAVISVHVGGVLMTAFSHGSIEFAVGNLFDGPFRFCIPLFLMISGALLLDEAKPYDLSDFVKKSFQMIVLYCFWSAFYVVILPIIEQETFTVSVFLKRFSDGAYHLWYLKMMAGIYLVIPILRLFVKKSNCRYIRYLILLGTLFALLPPFLSFSESISNGIIQQIFQESITQLERLNPDFIGFEILYLLLGWYLFHIPLSSKIFRISLYIMSIFGIFFTLIYVYMTGDFDYPYSGKQIFVVILAAAIFDFIIHLPEFQNSMIRSLIIHLSKYSFGIYITHVFFLELTKYFLPYGGTHPLLYPILLLILISGFTILTCMILSKIPLMRTLIRLSPNHKKQKENTYDLCNK